MEKKLQNKIKQIMSVYYRHVSIKLYLLNSTLGKYLNPSKTEMIFQANVLYISYSRIHLLWCVIINTFVCIFIYTYIHTLIHNKWSLNMVCLYFSPSPKLVIIQHSYFYKYISNQMDFYFFLFHRYDSISHCIVFHIMYSALGSI